MRYRKKYNGSGWSSARHRSDRGYEGKAYTDFRKIVRKRDKNKCQMPGCRGRKRLQVHHIIRWTDSPHLRYEERNGILLCKNCHDLIKNQEAYYIELFSRIVEQKYNDNP
jgi:hypothetical protein